jgi:hypothetical protein
MTGRPWVPAALWLAFLGPFFFLSYNFANGYASRLEHVPSIAFDWERHLPFLPWTIVPYWSSDLLYALSLALCRTRAELNRHGLRLLAIQIVSVACFVAFPLRYAFERPPMTGLPAYLFDLLTGFDQPFNQAPSLHVSLAVILWIEYRKHLPGRWLRQAVAAWFVLLAVSAWTTYQHQFIDLPTGLWAGLLVLAALPEREVRESRRPRLVLFYLAGAVLLCGVAFTLRGWFWMLLWPSFALSLVAAGYWTGDPAWLGKRRDNGRMPFWMWPYVLGAWCNARIWATQERGAHNLLADGVWIGRAPAVGRADMRCIVDLTAELPVSADVHIPVLDLTIPTLEQLDLAVAAIEGTQQRPLLLCCALGYSRSAIAGAAWLLATGRALSAEEAVAMVQRARPCVVIRPAGVQRLREWTRHTVP